MKTVSVNAYAKLNLTLDVLGKTGDFHEIDSLVTTVSLFDRIVIRARKDALFSISMRGMGSEEIPLERNSALLAAEAFKETFKTRGADITVYKNIPMGAGMGGSSVDAAGVLKGLALLFGIGEELLPPLAETLSSDTSCLLKGGLVRMRGRGERIEPIKTGMKFYFLLLVPKRGVDTAACYQMSDSLPRCAPATESALKKIMAGDCEGAARCFQNALFPAACRLQSDVKTAFDELLAFSPWAVNMTGSGSGVYAVFETEELCAWAKSRYRGKFSSYLLKSVNPTR